MRSRPRSARREKRSTRWPRTASPNRGSTNCRAQLNGDALESYGSLHSVRVARRPTRDLGLAPDQDAEDLAVQLSAATKDISALAANTSTCRRRSWCSWGPRSWPSRRSPTIDSRTGDCGRRGTHGALTQELKSERERNSVAWLFHECRSYPSGVSDTLQDHQPADQCQQDPPEFRLAGRLGQQSHPCNRIRSHKFPRVHNSKPSNAKESSSSSGRTRSQ